jgi:long-chain fatty acid transport protein
MREIKAMINNNPIAKTLGGRQMSTKFKYMLAATTLLASSLVQATNGMFLPGYGVQSMSMGGVGISSGQDAISAAANPANISFVGMRGDIDVTLFNPRVKSYVRCGGPFYFGCYNDPVDPDTGTPTSAMGWVDSDSELYVMPNMAVAMPITDKLSVGLGFIAASGMGSSFVPNFFSFNGSNTPPDDHNLGIQLMQMIIPITVAYKPVDSQSIGFSLVPAIQRFNASGLQAFEVFNISSDPDRLTNQGNDYSFGAGAKIGWIGKFLNNGLALGATYASEVKMSTFDSYKGLFANKGDLDIPANYGIGITVRPNDDWMFAFDVTQILYSDVPAIGNPGPGKIGTVPNIVGLAASCPNISPYCLGGSQGMGFGWRDQTVYKLGVAFKATPKLTLKAGLNYAKTPIPDELLTFNLLAPATTERHYSLGFTYTVNDNLDISGMYMRATPNSQHAAQMQVIGAGGFAMNQNFLGIGLSWILDRPSN